MKSPPICRRIKLILLMKTVLHNSLTSNGWQVIIRTRLILLAHVCVSRPECVDTGEWATQNKASLTIQNGINRPTGKIRNQWLLAISMQSYHCILHRCWWYADTAAECNNIHRHTGARLPNIGHRQFNDSWLSHLTRRKWSLFPRWHFWMQIIKKSVFRLELHWSCC